MPRHMFVLLTSLGLALSIGALLAQKPSKPGGGGGGGGNTLYPVTAEFRCPLTAACQTPDAIEGDSLGVYHGTTPGGGPTTPEGTAENLGAYFTEGNLFLFSLKSGLGRFIRFDFSGSVGTAPCVAAHTCRKDFTAATTDVSLPGSRTYPVDALGSDLPNGFASIPVGGSARARSYINFADPGGRSLLWTVRFDPVLYPGSSFLTVTRPAASTWTIEATSADLAQLVSATTSGKSVKVNEGYYRMPFHVSVTQ